MFKSFGIHRKIRHKTCQVVGRVDWLYQKMLSRELKNIKKVVEYSELDDFYFVVNLLRSRQNIQLDSSVLKQLRTVLTNISENLATPQEILVFYSCLEESASLMDLEDFNKILDRTVKLKSMFEKEEKDFILEKIRKSRFKLKTGLLSKERLAELEENLSSGKGTRSLVEIASGDFKIKANYKHRMIECIGEDKKIVFMLKNSNPVDIYRDLKFQDKYPAELTLLPLTAVGAPLLDSEGILDYKDNVLDTEQYRFNSRDRIVTNEDSNIEVVNFDQSVILRQYYSVLRDDERQVGFYGLTDETRVGALYDCFKDYDSEIQYSRLNLLLERLFWLQSNYSQECPACNSEVDYVPVPSLIGQTNRRIRFRQSLCEFKARNLVQLIRESKASLVYVTVEEEESYWLTRAFVENWSKIQVEPEKRVFEDEEKLKLCLTLLGIEPGKFGEFDWNQEELDKIKDLLVNRKLVKTWNFVKYDNKCFPCNRLIYKANS